MCLLIVVSRVLPQWPLIIAANRDERLHRPAEPVMVLRGERPQDGGRPGSAGRRHLAGRERPRRRGGTDEQAGDRRPRSVQTVARGNPSRADRSRQRGAAGISTFGLLAAGGLQPVLGPVGDRSSLHYVDVTQPDRVRSVELTPGIHVLENKPLEEPSKKAEHVRQVLGDVRGMRVDQVLARLRRVMTDHAVNEDPADDTERSQLVSRASACCVHTEEYGTRSLDAHPSVCVPLEGTGGLVVERCCLCVPAPEGRSL